MKILLVHYRYFIVGGPERYFFNIIKKLEAEGHEVVPFSIRSNKNIESVYSKYFIDPIGNLDSVFYDEYQKTPRVLMQLLKRSFYDPSVEHAAEKIIDETQPDVIYIMCYLNKMSPSVIRAAKKSGKRVVIRLSDYGLMCPTYSFLYNREICEQCMQRGYRSCIKNKCVQNSSMASLVRVLSMKFHDLIHIYDDVDAFITPSLFLKEKLLQYKFKDEKKEIVHIPTFTPFDPKIRPLTERRDYGLYFGRISPEKGLEYVIRAYEKLGSPFKLKVVGETASDEAKRLMAYADEHHMQNVEFAGFKLGEELLAEIRGARYVFVPSIWYDNFPNVVLEAYMNGKPVIASRLGSLPEMVAEGETGILFEPKDVDDIVSSIRKIDCDEILDNMGQYAYDYLIEHYGADTHYSKLIRVLEGKQNA